jgi:uncharacterized protein
MSSLLDVNVCLALSLAGHQHHNQAIDWYNSLEGREAVIICRPVQLGMLRLLTTQAMTSAYSLKALSNAAAWQVLMGWMTRSNVIFQQESESIEAEWKNFATRSSASPKLWMDAYLAAFAKDADLTLVTTDKAFLQFKGCRVQLLA